jgi:hypothetical protein
MASFLTPAGISDFDADPALYATWNKNIADIFHDLKTLNPDDDYEGYPAFYSPLAPPSPVAPASASPTWPGLPLGLTARFGDDKGAELSDKIVPWGTAKDDEGFSSEPFKDTNGNPVDNNGYRQQDEYLEWTVHHDQQGHIIEIVFTCEGPEYWSCVAQNQNLLLKLYQTYVSPQVQLADLLFPQDTTWIDPNDPSKQVQTFSKGDYNPYNRWNMTGAMHLTHPANTLGAEITLAAQSSALFTMQGKAVKTNPNLTCCRGIGEINRSSDPNIASAVNGLTESGNYITLRNPIGLYILDVNAASFAMPDGSPIPNFVDGFFQKVRGSADKKLTLRARLSVPAGMQWQGQPLFVSDLLCNNKPIRFGGQVAANITMGLFAEALPGAPAQQRHECAFQGCPDPNNPNVIVFAKAGSDCTKLHPAQPTAFSAPLSLLKLEPKAFGGRHSRIRTRVRARP